MNGTLFGISYFTLGLASLGLAVVWYFVWPKDRTPEPLKRLPEYRPRPAWMESVLRWFHLLTWALLAAMFLFLGAEQSTLASVSALLAGALYLTFVIALVKDAQRRKAFEHESLNPPANRQSGG